MPVRARHLLPLLLATASTLRAQDTRPVLPGPESRPVPVNAADVEERIRRVREFVEAERARLGDDRASYAAQRAAILEEQLEALQRLGVERRRAAEEAAESAESARARVDEQKRLDDLREAERRRVGLPDPRAPDAEPRLKAERERAEADAKEARAAREAAVRALEAARNEKESVPSAITATEAELQRHLADAEDFEADARDYLAAGLDEGAVLARREQAQLARLRAAEAESRLARQRRLAGGLLDDRVALAETRIAAEDVRIRTDEARLKEIDRLLDEAIAARYERARNEVTEIDRIIEVAAEWAKPYWRMRRRLAELGVSRTEVTRALELWKGRAGDVGEIRYLASEAQEDRRELDDVDAERIEVDELLTAEAPTVESLVAVHRERLERALALMEQARADQRRVREWNRVVRRESGEALVAAASDARRDAPLPETFVTNAWYEAEAASEQRWSELVAALRTATSGRREDVARLDAQLKAAVESLATTVELRERNLVRLQLALRWTREGAQISLESVERAVRDARAAPEWVRGRALGALSRLTAYWVDTAKSRAWGRLALVGGALAGAVLLLVFAARALPRTAKLLEDWTGPRVWLAYFVHVGAVLLRKTVWTGLLAFCAVGLPAIAGAPAEDVQLLAVLLGAPFAIRTLRVLIDVTFGREPRAKRPFAFNAVLEGVLYECLRRLLIVAAIFVPAALLLTVAGYREVNPGFVSLLWLLHSLSSYAVVLVTALRPRRFLSAARKDSPLATRFRTALIVGYPVTVGAIIFLIVLRSLGYVAASAYFLGRILETAAWLVGASIAYRRLKSWVTRDEPRVPPPTADPIGEEEKWVAEGRAWVADRMRRGVVKLAVLVPVAWFVLDMWGLTGAGYEAVFRRPIWGAGRLAAAVGAARGVEPGAETRPVEAAAAAPTGATPLTWADVMAAIFTTVLAFYVVRWTRDLLRFHVLPRTGFDFGLRYTVTTLVTYLLVGVSGVVILGGQLRIDPTVIGAFIAALGVGLGFGLKEIVDNFFSGIILLVERPIKVGDVVTVDAFGGRVDRINMRSTTVITPENKGVVIPNKDLISKSVVNWSAGPKTIRWMLPLQIAYGSDTQLFKKTALDTLDRFGLVLKTPSPEVIFAGFGDSGLNFEVYFFVRLSTNGWRLRSDLNYAFDLALRTAGISVPFPTRDLLLKPGSEVLLKRPPKGPAAPPEPPKI
ncbi:MAG TPA: mechanosensitive ion channel domain-containing protein [Planctomycetota bacterium]|nr:mechanosensitive ion channel domain-containing protein [Planctomycetota bacterium]